MIEIKRDVEKAPLAQCLEYAGWARTTNLQELAGLYKVGSGHEGAAAFFMDWQEFTATSTPVTIVSPPRLILVAGGFRDRTRAALELLRERGLPVSLITLSIYKDAESQQIINVDRDHVGQPGTSGKTVKVKVADLLGAGLIQPNEKVEFIRLKKREFHFATVLPSGVLQLESGELAATPTRAATLATNGGSFDGWLVWHVPRLDGATLDEMRQQYLAQLPSES